MNVEQEERMIDAIWSLGMSIRIAAFILAVTFAGIGGCFWGQTW